MTNPKMKAFLGMASGARPSTTATEEIADAQEQQPGETGPAEEGKAEEAGASTVEATEKPKRKRKVAKSKDEGEE